MERLTETELTELENSINMMYDDVLKTAVLRAIDELKSNRAIEKEIGVELPTIFNALKSDIYVSYNEDGDMDRLSRLHAGCPKLICSPVDGNWYIGSDKYEDEKYFDFWMSTKDFMSSWEI